MSGILFIVSAPSGAGKTSLVQALLDADPRLAVSVSHTTRPRRPKEIDGVNYHFVDHGEFETMIAEGAFIEYAEVHGNYYGTSRAAVTRALTSDSDVVLEIDWQGAASIRRAEPAAVSVFIMPPSLSELRERLTNRGQDEPRVIESRLAAARGEMRHHREFDYLVFNDDFDTALSELRAITSAERCRLPAQADRNATLIDALLGG